MVEILIAIGILGGLGLIFGLILAAASKLFYVETDPRLEQPENRPVLTRVRQLFSDTPDIFN